MLVCMCASLNFCIFMLLKHDVYMLSNLTTNFKSAESKCCFNSWYLVLRCYHFQLLFFCNDVVIYISLDPLKLSGNVTSNSKVFINIV